MGHGVAAGLLTMFIKEAIVGRRTHDIASPVRCPSEVLTSLNADLAAQQLPNCQFVTACYGQIDIQSHEVVFARACHPHPIHISRDGQAREVETAGGLLGVFSQARQTIADAIEQVLLGKAKSLDALKSAAADIDAAIVRYNESVGK